MLMLDCAYAELNDIVCDKEQIILFFLQLNLVHQGCLEQYVKIYPLTMRKLCN